MDGLLFALTLAAVLGCGLSAGALFGFSSFVMQALAALRAPEGIRAMQSINVLAVTPVFMTALFGTGVVCGILGVWGIASLEESYGVYLVVGAALYLAGPVGVTMGYHVPRNNSLAAADPDSPDGAELWARYLIEWTRGNHVRAAAGIAASAAFAIALAGG